MAAIEHSDTYLLIEKKDFITQTPPEIALQILGKLNLEDFNKCRQVCRRWEALTSDPILWQNFVKNAKISIPKTSFFPDLISFFRRKIYSWKEVEVQFPRRRLVMIKSEIPPFIENILCKDDFKITVSKCKLLSTFILLRNKLALKSLSKPEVLDNISQEDFLELVSKENLQDFSCRHAVMRPIIDPYNIDLEMIYKVRLGEKYYWEQMKNATNSGCPSPTCMCMMYNIEKE